MKAGNAIMLVVGIGASIWIGVLIYNAATLRPNIPDNVK